MIAMVLDAMTPRRGRIAHWKWKLTQSLPGSSRHATPMPLVSASCISRDNFA